MHLHTCLTTVRNGTETVNIRHIASMFFCYLGFQVNPLSNFDMHNCIFQIRQYGRLEDGSLNVVTRGQQRFRLRRHWIDAEGVVRIIIFFFCWSYSLCILLYSFSYHERLI